ncbi:OmpA family protein, partial [Riemerella anatipestifer]
VVTGDDEFDGGGSQYSERNKREDQVSDNFFNATLGMSLKLGKHVSHLMWHDPLQEIYNKLDLATVAPAVEVCKSGDSDNDGVCDDWDRQLDTPAGARVDGAGVALDVDLDGVIDLYDKCVTVPGPVSNNGCPEESQQVKEVNRDFEGIEFALNSDVIRPQSFGKLDNAANIIKGMGLSKQYLVVVGATDTRGSASYNLNLSKRRANSVVKYLVNKGVSASVLKAEGRGKNDLKYPECNPATKCPEWKNEANRRVYFEVK